MYVVLPYMFERFLELELERKKNAQPGLITVGLLADDILIIFNGLPKVVAQPLAFPSFVLERVR